MTLDLTLSYPPPAEPLSMNDKDNRSTGRAKQAWRDRAFWALCEAFPGEGPSGRRLPPSDVMMVIPFDTARRRDPINWTRTVKATVDGLVNAGAWPDDTPEHVTQNVPALVDSDATGGMVLVRIVGRR